MSADFSSMPEPMQQSSVSSGEPSVSPPLDAKKTDSGDKSTVSASPKTPPTVGPVVQQTLRQAPTPPPPPIQISHQSTLVSHLQAKSVLVEPDSQLGQFFSTIKKAALAVKMALGMADKINREHEDYKGDGKEKLGIKNMEKAFEKLNYTEINSMMEILEQGQFGSWDRLKHSETTFRDLHNFSNQLDEIINRHGKDVGNPENQMLAKRAQKLKDKVDNEIQSINVHIKANEQLKITETLIRKLANAPSTALVNQLNREVKYLESLEGKLNLAPTKEAPLLVNNIKQVKAKAANLVNSMAGNIKTENREGQIVVKMNYEEMAELKKVKDGNPQAYYPQFDVIAGAFASATPATPLADTIKITSPALQTAHVEVDKDDARLKAGEDRNKPHIYPNGNGTVRMAVISGYPANTKDNTRSGDPVADHMTSQTFSGANNTEVMVFSAADGSGWGPRALGAAVHANSGFTKGVVEQLQSEGVQDRQALSKVAVNAVGKAQQEIVKAGEDNAKFTTHTGIIACKNKTTGKVNGVITSVGDMKVFILKKDGKVVEVTKGNRGNATDPTDPGGQLGPLFKDGNPDLRNLSIYHFEAEAGDVLLPMSDGVHDNLDPSNMPDPKDPTKKLTPQDAKTLMQNSKVVGFDTRGLDELVIPLDWKTESPELEAFKTKFLAFNLARIAQQAQSSDPPKPLADALTESAFNAGAAKRTYMEENPSQREPLMPGKQDHISCAQINL